MNLPPPPPPSAAPDPTLLDWSFEPHRYFRESAVSVLDALVLLDPDTGSAGWLDRLREVPVPAGLRRHQLSVSQSFPAVAALAVAANARVRTMTPPERRALDNLNERFMLASVDARAGVAATILLALQRLGPGAAAAV